MDVEDLENFSPKTIYAGVPLGKSLCAPGLGDPRSCLEESGEGENTESQTLDVRSVGLGDHPESQPFKENLLSI